MEHYKTRSLLRALQKHGVAVQSKVRECAPGVRPTTWYGAENSRNAIDWFDQGDGTANCVRVRGLNDHDDLTTDYFAGTFATTISSALNMFLDT
jgi:hypothetical protein